MYGALLGALGKGAITIASDAVVSAAADKLTRRKAESGDDLQGSTGAQFKQYLGDDDGASGASQLVDDTGMHKLDYKGMLEHLDKRDQKNFQRDARYAGAVRLGNALGGNVESSQWWGGYASIPQ